MTNIESKKNSVGELFKIPLKNTTILNIFTKAGKYRGGKIYSQEKFFTIISGSVQVTVNIGDKDINNTYLPGLIFNIPANVPNLFYFPEDCEMLEWFPKDVEAEKFEGFRKMK